MEVFYVMRKNCINHSILYEVVQVHQIFTSWQLAFILSQVGMDILNFFIDRETSFKLELSLN
jgi:hypothetical protein